MKKVLVLLFVLSFGVILSACTQKTYELALVTDVGTIDDGSFNQGAWEGLKAFAEDNDISYKYYQPSADSTDARVATIELAIENGATTVVTPGYMFENAIWLVQSDHPDVNFIFLDGSPSNVSGWDDQGNPILLTGETAADFTVEDNVLPIFYKEQEAGFLAGYAAVMDGNTKLGFVGGMAVPAVVRFGYGYIQGAAYAAEELELTAPVEVVYWYSGVFWADNTVSDKAASWFTTGTEVIFAAAGGAGASVMSAAEQATDGKVIGVDIDQKDASETVITSAMKELANSVYAALESIYDETFVGGTAWNLGSVEDGVGLPQDFTRFDTFDQADYDAIFALLTAGTVVVSGDITVDADSFDSDYVTVIVE
ncbi:MAG: BMP family ABC transporter substrate-binding protein [Firmicutes bacterium]|nr:BMP family ABC transporter substrate-binding protein [Bacillota bacterium]